MLMQTFVDDLLDLKQIQEGAFRLVNQAFDPIETIKMVYTIFEPQARAKGVKIVIEIYT